ncbi:hypothetical protein GCM10007874_54720 [Labrys miyagiensis]|uniref:Uncharacterized protein n=1 Tax=Labrys miyagiensis TaxID=346912 RepID=A0ABQ6CUQ5_9HYPH|nr:hypothetical protein GCM10007874_54720 [Labrys miyagiensis]
MSGGNSQNLGLRSFGRGNIVDMPGQQIAPFANGDRRRGVFRVVVEFCADGRGILDMVTDIRMAVDEIKQASIA